MRYFQTIGSQVADAHDVCIAVDTVDMSVVLEVAQKGMINGAGVRKARHELGRVGEGEMTLTSDGYWCPAAEGSNWRKGNLCLGGNLIWSHVYAIT